MWFSIIAAVVVGALIYKLFISNPNKDFWKKRGVFEIDISAVCKPYEFLLGRKTLFDADAYAYAKMGDSHKYSGQTILMDSGRPLLMVKDLDLAKKVLIKDFDYFVDRRNFFTDADKSLKYVLTAITGDEWKGIRSSVSPTFTTGKIRRMMSIFNSVGREWVDHYIKEAKSTGGGSVNIQAGTAVSHYTVDVIASAVFGMNAGTIKDPDNAFSVNTKRFVTPGIFQMFNFGLRIRFPTLGRLLGLSVIDSQALNFFESIFIQAYKERLKGTGGIKRNDFLQMLLEAKKGELKAVGADELSEFEKEAQITAPNQKRELSVEEMNGQSLSFFFAGFSTTGGFITFTLYALALHPEIQDRLRAEVDTIVKEDGSLDYDDLGKLVYLDMIASEVLRKFSSCRLERLCVKDWLIEETGLVVPKGVIVAIPMNAIHQDKIYYPNADRFDPEHFSPENKAKRHPYAYMPFGLGPRNCIGMRFALVEGKAAIAHMVHHFRIEPTSKTPIPMQTVPFGLTLAPPKDLELKLTPIRN